MIEIPGFTPQENKALEQFQDLFEAGDVGALWDGLSKLNVNPRRICLCCEYLTNGKEAFYLHQKEMGVSKSKIRANAGETRIRLFLQSKSLKGRYFSNKNEEIYSYVYIKGTLDFKRFWPLARDPFRKSLAQVLGPRLWKSFGADLFKYLWDPKDKNKVRVTRIYNPPTP